MKEGTGELVHGRFVPATAHTMTDDKGGVVDSAAENAPYIWLPGEMNPPGSQVDAIQEGLMGMKVGGKRKIHIPAAMNASPPQVDTKRPQGVALTMDVELLSCRVLPGGPPQRR